LPSHIFIFNSSPIYPTDFILFQNSFYDDQQKENEMVDEMKDEIVDEIKEDQEYEEEMMISNSNHQFTIFESWSVPKVR